MGFGSDRVHTANWKATLLRQEQIRNKPRYPAPEAWPLTVKQVSQQRKVGRRFHFKVSRQKSIQTSFIQAIAGPSMDQDNGHVRCSARMRSNRRRTGAGKVPNCNSLPKQCRHIPGETQIRQGRPQPAEKDFHWHGQELGRLPTIGRNSIIRRTTKREICVQVRKRAELGENHQEMRYR